MSDQPSKPRRTSTWVMNEEPLQVLPSLACALGVDEAIFLQRVIFWLKLTKHEFDDRPWIYNTHPDWLRQMPFFSKRSLQRIINGLSDMGVLFVTDKYNAKPTDRTNWYAVDFEKLDRLMDSWAADQKEGGETSITGEDSESANMASSRVPKWHTRKRQNGTVESANMAPSIIRNQTTLTIHRDDAAASGEPALTPADPLPPGGGVEDSPSKPKTGGEKSSKAKTPKQPAATDANGNRLVDHPLIRAYCDFHQENPTIAQMKLIIEANPPLDNWVRAMRSWNGLGYRKVNIARQLQWALNPALIEEGEKPPAKKNASILAQPGDTYVPSPEEEEETRVWREKLRSTNQEEGYPAE